MLLYNTLAGIEFKMCTILLYCTNTHKTFWCLIPESSKKNCSLRTKHTKQCTENKILEELYFMIIIGA